MGDQFIREEKLPDEILESQKTRSSLLQWKLLLCSTIGTVAFGLTEHVSNSNIGLLGLIPLACAYVDLLCTNINLRIILIGTYFKRENDPYESFVGPFRVVFSLEDWALYGSTYVITGLVIIVALANLILMFSESPFNKLMCWECGGILLSSLIALILTQWTFKSYNLLKKLKELKGDENSQEYFEKQLSNKDFYFKLFMNITKGKSKTGK